jgi:predicted ABC-type ATPase
MRPQLAIIAGPNGAGKSTLAPRLLFELLRIKNFVNADVIAKGLSAFDPESRSLEAGRYMLEQLHRYADARMSFAFETTLSSRSFAKWIDGLVDYEVSLIFLWLPDADIAIRRVAARIAKGGHHVPDEVVRRRHRRGLVNFFELYQSRAHYWQVYNGVGSGPTLMAEGCQDDILSIADAASWKPCKRPSGHELTSHD